MAAVFHVRSGAGAAGPWTYTVGAGAEASDSLAFTGSYDFAVYGPNGFYRGFQGDAGATLFLPVHHGGRVLLPVRVSLEAEVSYDEEHNGVTLVIRNEGAQTCAVSIVDGYSRKVVGESVNPGASASLYFALAKTHGWYDLQVTSADVRFARHLAGHVETGRDSMTDPAIGEVEGNRRIGKSLQGACVPPGDSSKSTLDASPPRLHRGALRG